MVTTDLSKSEVECVAEIIWRLCEYRGKTQARAEVLKLVTELVHADYAASFVWDAQRRKSTQRVAVNISDAALDHYDQYFYQTDNVTPALRACVSATNVDNVIARPQLLGSEFYVDFLKPAGMYHGLNIYFFDNGVDVGDLRIWRGAGGHSFTPREERILNSLSPYFVRSLSPTIHPTHGLSGREADVARLVANGASDKEVARQLGIAFTTVRTHLNHAMCKLDCANRTQLARHF